MKIYKKSKVILDSFNEVEIYEYISNLFKSNITSFKCFGLNLSIIIKYWIREHINCEFKYSYIKRILSEKISKHMKTISTNSTLNYVRYIEFGYTYSDAKLYISHLQKTRSCRCIEYWIKKGYSVEDAINQLKSIQSVFARCGIIKTKEQYWIDLGYSIEDACRMAKEHKQIYNSVQKVRESNISIREFNEKYNSYSIDKLCRKHNISYNEAKNIIDKRKRILSEKASGKNNPMYGKPSPLMSGSSFSGYYKDFHFRSLPEYYFIKRHECDGIKSAEVTHKIALSNGTTYHPDFIIGDRLIEIKADWKINRDDTIMKITELKINFPHLTVDLIPASSIQPVCVKDIREDMNNNYLRIDANKKSRFEKYIERMTQHVENSQ